MTSNSGVGTFVTEAHELVSNGLDIFNGPTVDSSLLHGKTFTIYPSSVITQTGPYDFIVPSDGQDWTDLPFTRLEGLIEITKADGTALGDTDLNAYVNMLPHSIFKQLEVYINNTLVSDLSTPTYPWKCIIEKILSYPEDVKKTALQLEMYDEEDLGKENTFTKDSKVFKKRHAKAVKGKCYFSVVLHSDIFHSVKYLMPGCEMKLKLIRNTDDFVILGATKIAKTKISELCLQVRRVTVDDVLLDKLESTLTSKPAIYPLTPGRIKTATIYKEIKVDRVSNLYRGILPKSIIFCFVKSKAFDGDVASNPFVFEHFDLNGFQVYVNGEPHFAQPLQPDFDSDKYFREYRWFLDNIGLGHGSNSVGIDMETFKTNKFFIPIDFSPNLSNGFDLTPPKEGFIDVMISFKNALPQNVTMIAYATFNEILTIDKDRRVTLV